LCASLVEQPRFRLGLHFSEGALPLWLALDQPQDVEAVL
jgi:hypothetical protein